MVSIENVAAVVFWASIAVIGYTYGCYAVLIWCLARCFGKRAGAPGAAMHEHRDIALPAVSLLIAAYNEQAVIADRLEKALASNYPKDKLEIVVGSDGSSDQTASEVRRFEQRGVRLLDYEQRRGKASVLNS